jgi:ribulose-phosphate 3-epimerase
MKTIPQLIPSINALEFNDLKEKILMLKSVTNRFHVDLAEEKFTGSHRTWLNPVYLDWLDQDLIIDLHLMLFLKPQEILKWLKKQVKSVAIHLEAVTSPNVLIRIVRKFKKKILIAWSPDVEFEFIRKYLDYVNGILILGVKPGASGQNFIDKTYERLEIINNFRKINKKKISLMIDGGINLDNLKKVCRYSPDFIIMGSAIYSDPDPVKAFLEIKNNLKF